MHTGEFLVLSRLDVKTLDAWIEAGWVRPDRKPTGHEFSDIDLARVRLIDDLRKALGVNDEAVPIILDLLDQIHGLRRVVRGFVERSRQ